MTNHDTSQRAGDRVAPIKRNEALLPPWARILAYAALAAGIYFVMQRPPVQSVLGARVQLPALFASDPIACPEADRIAARAIADETRVAADLKRERSPFYANDGVRAVDLFEKAAACYEVSGDPQTAAELKAAADDLRTRINDELRVRQVQLERFLVQQQYASAQREIVVLQALVRHRDGPYTAWLSAVQREINTRFGSAK